MPDVTPLDIMGAEFPGAFRGFDRDAVRTFLQQLAASLENLVRERGELRQKIHHLEEELSTYRQRESALQEALVAAQRSADETVEHSRQEAQNILAEAHGLADRIIDEAQNRSRHIEVAISALRGHRRECRGELRRLIEILEGVIEDDREHEESEREKPRIAILHPKGEQQKA